MKRKTAHQELVHEADSWVRAIVFHRQGPKCLKCHESKPLHAAHILSKGANPALRFDLENVIGLCMKDHIFWAHRNPVGFTDWIEEIFPGRLARLREMTRHHCKIDVKELICVLKSIARKEGVPCGN
jgi:5-methylcytosine-specific restriction endonuclease McrA